MQAGASPGLEPAPGAAEGLGAGREVNPNPKQDGGAGGGGRLEPPALCLHRAGRVAAAGAWLPARPASPRAASRLPALRSLSAFPGCRASPPSSQPLQARPGPPLGPRLAPQGVSAHFEPGSRLFSQPQGPTPTAPSTRRASTQTSPSPALRQRWGKTGSCLVIDSPPPSGPPRRGSLRSPGGR